MSETPLCRTLVFAGAVLSGGCRELGDDILHSTPIDSGSVLQAVDDGPQESAIDTGAPPSTTAELDRQLGAWGSVEPPTPLPALASNFNDDDPTLTADLLELYFTSTRGPTGTDIWVSKRAATDLPWGVPALVAPLNTADTEDTPEIAPDGYTMWFVRSVKGTTTGRDVYVTTRSSRNAAWSPGRLVSELSSSFEDYSPTPSVDGLSMVMSSYRSPSIGADDLFTTHRASLASPWTAPAWVPVLESTARESGPFRPGDETLVYFTSLRTGTQIWRATRADSTAPWSAPGELSELAANQHGAEQPWISSDLHLMVFVIKAPNQPTQIAEVRR